MKYRIGNKVKLRYGKVIYDILCIKENMFKSDILLISAENETRTWEIPSDDIGKVYTKKRNPEYWL